MQSMHPYENSISNQPPEQSPPVNKDRFFYFPGAVFIRKFDCIYIYVYIYHLTFVCEEGGGGQKIFR